MTAPSSAPERIRFDAFEADLRTGELWKSGRKLRIPNQSFLVLTMLLDRAGQLVTREELRARLWPSGTFVEYDQSLNAAINRLREALRDSAEKPRFIETLPKRGYRFIGSIHRPSGEGAPAVSGDSSKQALVPDAAAQAVWVRSGESTEQTPTPAVDTVPADAISPGATRSSRRIGVVVAAAALTVLLVIAGTVFWVGNHTVSELPPHREVVPFTSLPGQELAPTFSPDGSQIAFAWNGETGDDHQFELYVKEVGSERLLRLTDHPAKEIVPAWSPDGGSLAFVRVTEGQAGIFLIPALGGVERPLVSISVALGHVIRISWSPDGKRIAYPAYGRNGAQEVYLVSVDTLQTQPLRLAPECQDAMEPAFSPDGAHLALACTSSYGVYAIYVVGISDGLPKRLISMMGDPQGIAWSHDGRRIVFANDTGRGGELWQVTMEGRPTQLSFGEDGSAPAVAARGERMAYVRARNITNIWRVDLTAASPEESAAKLIYSTRAQHNPRYSDDGKHIAFQSNRSGSMEIWLTDGEGKDPLRLTTFNGSFTDTPTWCSDGRRIAFDSSASGNAAIYIEDIAERLPRKVATSRINLSRPAWSRDCRWLFASDGKPTLYRFPASGGPAQPFTNLPAYYATVLADRVIFSVMESTGLVLWSKSAAGGPEKVLEQMPRLGYGDAWTANSSGIYYTDSSAGQPTLNFYDFAKQTTRRIMTLKKTPVPGGGFGMAVSSDNHWLLYTQVDDLQSDIMLGPSS